MIPKILHYCWFGRSVKPPQVLRCIESWQKHNPAYELREWNEDNFDVTTHPFIREAYNAGKYAYVADAARMHALVAEGGIYLDTDTEVRGSFDPFLHHHSFIGKEHPYILGTNVIGAEKGCGWLAEFAQRYYDPARHFITPTGVLICRNNTAEITEFIGSKFPNNVDVAIYDIDYFCAKLFYGDGRLYITPRTVAVHHFSGTWMENPTLIRSIIYRFKRIYARYCKK